LFIELDPYLSSEYLLLKQTYVGIAATKETVGNKESKITKIVDRI